ncbi:gp16 family protein [Afifella pfennigii]|uniref:gp16 family protein n=1 Tax=Afifella pfennigii TaxID=209897 RepID=UPI00047A45AE|nr:regulatory protein GemA [Afifella pfennigii]
MNVLAAIHVAKRDLGLDDGAYRAVLARVTGKSSAGAMSESERRMVLAELRRLGFKGSSKRGRKAPSGPYAKKAQALWIALWNLGAVADKRDQALLAFVKRQTGIERTEWVLDAGHGRAVVEALKAWCEREGVDWSVGQSTEDHKRRYGYKIALAQWRKLHPSAPMPDFWRDIGEMLGRTLVAEKPSDEEWIRAMNALGEEIREGGG